jgi:hypothetical protein
MSSKAPTKPTVNEPVSTEHVIRVVEEKASGAPASLSATLSSFTKPIVEMLSPMKRKTPVEKVVDDTKALGTSIVDATSTTAHDAYASAVTTASSASASVSNAVSEGEQKASDIVTAIKDIVSPPPKTTLQKIGDEVKHVSHNIAEFVSPKKAHHSAVLTPQSGDRSEAVKVLDMN